MTFKFPAILVVFQKKKKERRKKKEGRKKKLDYLNYIGLFNHPCVRVYSGRHSWPPSGTHKEAAAPHTCTMRTEHFNPTIKKEGNREIGK
jgi:hypothetical protein